MTITCRHCGPVNVTDRNIVRAVTDTLDALAIGHAPLGAITCPMCHDEVKANKVTR